MRSLNITTQLNLKVNQFYTGHDEGLKSSMSNMGRGDISNFSSNDTVVCSGWERRLTIEIHSNRPIHLKQILYPFLFPQLMMKFHSIFTGFDAKEERPTTHLQ